MAGAGGPGTRRTDQLPGRDDRERRAADDRHEAGAGTGALQWMVNLALPVWAAVVLLGAALVAAFLPGRPRAALVQNVGTRSRDDMMNDLVFSMDSPKATLATVGGKGRT
ncbi:hypothetical protein ACFQ0G_11230 [Streptomyces chiangmaiensis]